MKTRNMKTLSLRKPIGRSPCWSGCLAILLALVYVAFSQTAQALLPAPTPDGAYPGWNTAEGSGALFNVTTGTFNTAVGGHALFGDTTGNANTAVGAFALAADSTGFQNVAVGQGALGNNNGFGNVAVGYKALVNNTTSGNSSQAFGFEALFHQTTGLYNNGFGWRTLYSNVTGDNNTAIGDGAGSGITGSGNVDIGAGVTGLSGENNTTRIRNVDITTFTTGGFFLYEVNGAIGIFTSSRKFKDDIKPIDKASEAIYSLNPVTFRAKPQADPSRPRGFGLIAEDVEKVNPDLVSHGEKDILTVRYESINAMLLNEFLKAHKKVEEQQASIADLKSTVALQQKEMQVLTAQLKEQAAQIQKVSAQLEASKPMPKVVANR
jgi:hypothetical protein